MFLINVNIVNQRLLHNPQPKHQPLQHSRKKMLSLPAKHFYEQVAVRPRSIYKHELWHVQTVLRDPKTDNPGDVKITGPAGRTVVIN